MAISDHREFQGRGWAMPVAIDTRSGLVAAAAYEEDIRQAIRIIIETAPGERIMRPEFGCGIHDLVFAAPDSETLQRCRSLIEEALRRYEARIEVMSVEVASAPEAGDGRLTIELDYRVRNTNQVGNLVFPFYFREGGGR